MPVPATPITPRIVEDLRAIVGRQNVVSDADELLYASAAPRPIAAVKGLIAEGEWHGELAQVHRSGQEIFVESRWSLVRNDEGEAQSILVINTNVTEARKLQARQAAESAASCRGS